MELGEVRGSRVAIIGGSIAGCAAAVALDRLGCQVQVFERSPGALRDRGSGIAIPLPLREELIQHGYLDRDYPCCRPEARWWVLGNGAPAGRLLWSQPGTLATNNWGVLWRSLRARVPDDRYLGGTAVTAVEPAGGHVDVLLDDGNRRTFDVVVGADGYRSATRMVVESASKPSYAGYVLWRGNFPEPRLASRVGIDRLDAARAWLTVCYPQGHGVMYPIPDFDGSTEPGRRRINWAIYAPQPEGLDFVEPTSIPPGHVSRRLYDQLGELIHTWFPADYRPLFSSPPDEVSIQPIYDQMVHSYVEGRVLLIGDAGTLSRPHTGSGATKAMQDALCLERLGSEHGEWSALLTAYDAERAATGRKLVALGRRIGRDQVERTPPWADMVPSDFEAWTRSTLSGDALYFYPSSGEADSSEPE